MSLLSPLVESCSIIHSIYTSFVDEKPSLIVGKSRGLEIYSVTKESGLNLLHSLPTHSRIAALTSFTPPSNDITTKRLNWLVFSTIDKDLFVVSYDPKTNDVVTVEDIRLKGRGLRPLATQDFIKTCSYSPPSNNGRRRQVPLIAFHSQAGFISFLSVGLTNKKFSQSVKQVTSFPNEKNLQSLFEDINSYQIGPINIISMEWIVVQSQYPILVILYATPQYDRAIKLLKYTNNKVHVEKIGDYPAFDSQYNLIIPIEMNKNGDGYLLIGESSILFFQSPNPSENWDLKEPQPLNLTFNDRFSFKCYTWISKNNILFGSENGDYSILTITSYSPKTEIKATLKKVGNLISFPADLVNVSSTLNTIPETFNHDDDNCLFFVASTSGYPGLFNINSSLNINLIQQLQSLSPVLDLIPYNFNSNRNGNKISTGNAINNGYGEIFAASGGLFNSYINRIKSGLDVQIFAEIDISQLTTTNSNNITIDKCWFINSLNILIVLVLNSISTLRINLEEDTVELIDNWYDTESFTTTLLFVDTIIVDDIEYPLIATSTDIRIPVLNIQFSLDDRNKKIEHISKTSRSIIFTTKSNLYILSLPSLKIIEELNLEKEVTCLDVEEWDSKTVIALAFWNSGIYFYVYENDSNNTSALKGNKLFEWEQDNKTDEQFIKSLCLNKFQGDNNLYFFIGFGDGEVEIKVITSYSQRNKVSKFEFMKEIDNDDSLNCVIKYSDSPPKFRKCNNRDQILLISEGNVWKLSIDPHEFELQKQLPPRLNKKINNGCMVYIDKLLIEDISMICPSSSISSPSNCASDITVFVTKSTVLLSSLASYPDISMKQFQHSSLIRKMIHLPSLNLLVALSSKYEFSSSSNSSNSPSVPKPKCSLLLIDCESMDLIDSFKFPNDEEVISICELWDREYSVDGKIANSETYYDIPNKCNSLNALNGIKRHIRPGQFNESNLDSKIIEYESVNENGKEREHETEYDYNGYMTINDRLDSLFVVGTSLVSNLSGASGLDSGYLRLFSVSHDRKIKIKCAIKTNGNALALANYGGGLFVAGINEFICVYEVKIFDVMTLGNETGKKRKRKLSFTDYPNSMDIDEEENGNENSFGYMFQSVLSRETKVDDIVTCISIFDGIITAGNMTKTCSSFFLVKSLNYKGAHKHQEYDAILFQKDGKPFWLSSIDQASLDMILLSDTEGNLLVSGIDEADFDKLNDSYRYNILGASHEISSLEEKARYNYFTSANIEDNINVLKTVNTERLLLSYEDENKGKDLSTGTFNTLNRSCNKNLLSPRELYGTTLLGTINGSIYLHYYSKNKFYHEVLVRIQHKILGILKTLDYPSAGPKARMSYYFHTSFSSQVRMECINGDFVDGLILQRYLNFPPELQTVELIHCNVYFDILDVLKLVKGFAGLGVGTVQINVGGRVGQTEFDKNLYDKVENEPLSEDVKMRIDVTRLLP